MWKLLCGCLRPVRHGTRRRLGFEGLEGRQLLAGVIFVDGSEVGVDPDQAGIHIYGTAQNDQVEIDYEHFSENDVQLEVTFQTGSAPAQRFYFPLDFDAIPKIVFHGYQGDDRFLNKTGFTSFAHGGSGDDVLSGGIQEVHLFGDGGNDILLAGEFAFGELLGGGDNDTLHGTRLANKLDGGSGDDTLFGYDGDDKLRGGPGNDVLFGGSGNDTLTGGDDDDSLFGGEDDDRLEGEAGNDCLFGGNGYDLAFGGLNDDLLDGGRDGIQDALVGQAGADTFRRHYAAYSDYDFGVHYLFVEDLETDVNAAEGDLLGEPDFSDFLIDEEGRKYVTMSGFDGTIGAEFSGEQSESAPPWSEATFDAVNWMEEDSAATIEEVPVEATEQMPSWSDEAQSDILAQSDAYLLSLLAGGWSGSDESAAQDEQAPLEEVIEDLSWSDGGEINLDAFDAAFDSLYTPEAGGDETASLEDLASTPLPAVSPSPYFAATSSPWSSRRRSLWAGL